MRKTLTKRKVKMKSNMSDERVFFVTKYNPQKKELYRGENPIAQGLTFAVASESGNYGYFSWFDKVNGVMRTIELQSEPKIKENKNSYEVRDTDGYYYGFELLDKDIYDKRIRSLMASSIDLATTEEVQKYLSNLNPYL